MNCFMPNHALQIDISSVKNGSADSCRFFFFVKKVGFFRTVDEQRLAMSGLRQTQALIPHLQSRCLPSFLLAVMFRWLAVVEYFFARPDVNLAHVHSSADGLTVTGLQFLCAGYNMLQRLTDKRYNKIKDIKGSRQFKCGAIGFASVFSVTVVQACPSYPHIPSYFLPALYLLHLQISLKTSLLVKLPSIRFLFFAKLKSPRLRI